MIAYIYRPKMAAQRQIGFQPDLAGAAEIGRRR